MLDTRQTRRSNSHVAFFFQITTDKLELYSVLCPGGYELSNSSGLGLECQCLEKTVDGIVNCELDQNSIIIQASFTLHVY